jgi:hypothetical protein
MKNIASFMLLVAVLLLSVVSPALASVTPTVPTPEPGTVLLIGGGIGALALYHRKRRS